MVVRMPPLVDVVLTLRPDGKVTRVETEPAGPFHGMFEGLVGIDLPRALSLDAAQTLRRALDAGGPERFHMMLPRLRDDVTRTFDVTLRRDGGEVRLFGRDVQPLAEAEAQLARAVMALEAGQSDLRTSEGARLAVLAFTTDAIALVDARTGRMAELSDAAAQILTTDRTACRGSAFAQYFNGRRRGAFLGALHDAARRNRGPLIARLDATAEEISLWPNLARVGDDRFLVCRMTRAHAAAAPDAIRFAAVAHAAHDGIVCLDRDGLVEQANEGFQSMVGADAAADLLGRPFGRFLSRGATDMRLLTDAGRLRTIAIQLVGLLHRRLAVEIAVADLPGGGLGLILRDVTLAKVTRGPASGAAPDAAMLSRVGTLPLRDIVSETTDAIERQCIAQAIALTGNNRAAAAEMLGLSRQSLYVKLRRYGLSDRGDG